MTDKLCGLFLNTEKAVCSIYESGKMAYECLILSGMYHLDYLELNEINRSISNEYDFYIFNYHWVTMGWLDTKFIKQLPGFKATIVLEVSINDPFACVSKDDFDAYLVLDPTCKHVQHNVYAFPRPLEIPLNPVTKYQAKKIPIIGTFGLSSYDKGFDEVIKAVNEEFDEALIRINIPKADYVCADNSDDFINYLANYPVKEEIKIEITHQYFDKTELINWCAQNTLNVFLYNRRIGNGLSATTDQAIASGRPLAISTNPTFRHIHSYITPYPYLSLKEAIEKTEPLVKKIQEDWKPLNFALKFEEVLQKNNIRPLKNHTINEIELRSVFSNNQLRKLQLSDFVPPIAHIIRRKLLSINTHEVLINKEEVHNNNKEVILLKPFAHPALKSYSHFQEDLLIEFLLNNKQNGFYLDIGANDPFFGSNTQRFYIRGWRGINIEPNFEAYKKITKNRKGDVNLNIAISENSGEFTFYLIGNDSSISTLDYHQAIKMGKLLNLEITSTSVKALPLYEVLDSYLDNHNIDFMSVNNKGHNLDVLKSNNWKKYRPTLVLVESNLETRDILLFMDKQNYLYVFSNYVNGLFVDKKTDKQNILGKITWN